MKFSKPTTVIRTMVYKKRMAPAGHVFFVAQKSIAWSADSNRIFSAYRVVKTEGLSQEDEQHIKDTLIKELEASIERKLAK